MSGLTNRGIPALALLFAALAWISPAVAQEGADPLRLGTVRNDTLVVERARVIAAALERNEMLAASGSLRDAAAADALGAWRGFLPQIQLGEFYLRSDDALNSFGYKLQNRVVGAADFNPLLLNEPGETDHYVTRLQLLQPLFNGGMGIYGKQAANAASRAAEHEHARAAETVRFNAVQAFEGLRLAQAYQQVMEAAVASAEGHVRQAESMVRNEMATEADLLQARVYLSGLRQRLIEVRNLVAVAGENIKLLTAVDTPLPLAAAPATGPAAEVPEALDPAAVALRSDLLAQREKAAAAAKMVGVARGALLPHVNLSLQRDWYSQEKFFGRDARSWSLGLYATLGFGVQNVGDIRKARAQSRAAGHMADFQERQAQVQAAEAWLAVRAAREQVQVAEDAVGAAREGLRIVTNQYREGLASMVDLLDTQAAAVMAEGSLVQARHDLSVGLANLEFSGAAAAGHTPSSTTPAPAAQ